MGLGGISIWQLLIILLIVLVLFGSKRVKSIGSDLGEAIKGFKKSMSDETERLEEKKTSATQERTVETEAEKVNKDNKPV